MLSAVAHSRPCVSRVNVLLVGRELASPTTGGFCSSAAAVPTGCWPCGTLHELTTQR